MQTASTPYYQYHLFFCTNLRENGAQCCQNHDAMRLCKYTKQRIKELGLNLQGVRVSSSGCMGRCAQGPTLVVYPQGVWYNYHNEADIDEIISQHIQRGKIVARLLVPDLRA